MNLSKAIGMGYHTTRQSMRGICIYVLGTALAVLLTGGLFVLTSPPLKELKSAYTKMQEESRNKTIAVEKTKQPEKVGYERIDSPVSPPAKKTYNPFSEHPAIRDWAFKKWPAFGFIGLLAAVLAGYLYSWQMVYLAGRSVGRDFVFRNSLTEAWSLLNEYFKATLTGIGFVLAGLGLPAGLGALFLWILPKVLAIVLTVLLAITSIVFLILLSILLSFWYPAIACERRGMWAGVRSSFRATKSRVFPLIGFYLVLSLIGLGVELIIRLMTAGIGLVGGIIPLPVMVVVAGAFVLGYLAHTITSFFTTSADIHYFLGVCGENS